MLEMIKTIYYSGLHWTGDYNELQELLDSDFFPQQFHYINKGDTVELSDGFDNLQYIIPLGYYIVKDKQGKIEVISPEIVDSFEDVSIQINPTTRLLLLDYIMYESQILYRLQHTINGKIFNGGYADKNTKFPAKRLTTDAKTRIVDCDLSGCKALNIVKSILSKSTVGKTVKIESCKIDNSKIEVSHLLQNSTITDSEVYNSTLQDSIIEDSTIENNSNICGSTITTSAINHSSISDSYIKISDVDQSIISKSIYSRSNLSSVNHTHVQLSGYEGHQETIHGLIKYFTGGTKFSIDNETVIWDPQNKIWHTSNKVYSNKELRYENKKYKPLLRTINSIYGWW